MAKSLFFSFIALLLTSSVFAQVGIKAGVNLASIGEEHTNVSSDDVENRSITAPVVGLVFNMKMGDHFAIQPELLYTQNGGRNKYSVLEINTEREYRVHYLEVPVLLKVMAGNAEYNGVGVHFGVGPFVGYALNGKWKSTTSVFGSDNIVTENDFTFDEEDDARRLNYGIIGAAGVSFGRLVFDLRYNYGLNNLLDSDANNNNDNYKILQTRGLALTLGYNF